MVLLSTVLALIVFAVWTCRLLERGAWGIRTGQRVMATPSQPSLRILLPYRKSILECQAVFLCFWSWKNLLGSEYPEGCSRSLFKDDPPPPKYLFFSERLFLYWEEMFFWCKPFSVSICDIIGTLLVFSWRQACCPHSSLFLSTSLVNIWHSTCLCLTPTSAGTEEGSRWFNPESPEPRTVSDTS